MTRAQGLEAGKQRRPNERGEAHPLTQQTLKKPCGCRTDKDTLTLERLGECGRRRPASVTLRSSYARGWPLGLGSRSNHGPGRGGPGTGGGPAFRYLHCWL
jgi:hypothetical protein